MPKLLILYFADRSQYVENKGSRSETLRQKTGGTQGYIKRTLFILMINDIGYP